MSGKKIFTLGAKERLKSRKTLDFLFKEGNHLAVHPFRITYSILKRDDFAGIELFPLKMGVGVSKRIFKKAKDRNLLKRRVRESFRTQKLQLVDALIQRNLELSIFFIYISRDEPDFDKIFEKTGEVIDRLKKQVYAHYQ